MLLDVRQEGSATHVTTSSWLVVQGVLQQKRTMKHAGGCQGRV